MGNIFISKRIRPAVAAIVLVASSVPANVFAKKPDTLPDMSNVAITEGVLSWNSVDKKATYHITVCDVNDTVSDPTTSYNLKNACEGENKTSGNYAVTLKAVGNNGKDLTTTWNGTYSYEQKLAKLATPTGLVWNDNVVSWNAVADATSYKVELHEGNKGKVEASKTVSGTTTSFILSHGVEYSFSVQAFADGFEKSDVAKSEVVLFEGDMSLKASISDSGMASWEAYPKAAGYHVSVGDEKDKAQKTGDTTELSMNIVPMLVDNPCAEIPHCKQDSYTVKIYAVDANGERISEIWTTTVPYSAKTVYTITTNNAVASSDDAGANKITSAKAGETVYLTASELEHKRFSGWKVNGPTDLKLGETTTVSFIMPTTNVDIEAEYVDLYAISVTNGYAASDADGVNTISEAAAGDAVYLFANEAPASTVFDSWTINEPASLTVVGDEKATFEMPDAAVSVVAEYRHVHTWSYSADGNVITAECGCGDSYTLTLNETVIEYTGSPISVGITNNISSVTGATPSEVTYAVRGSSTYGAAPSEVGKYTARITLGGATAYVDVEIRPVIVDTISESISVFAGRDFEEKFYLADLFPEAENVKIYEIENGEASYGDTLNAEIAGAEDENGAYVVVASTSGASGAASAKRAVIVKIDDEYYRVEVELTAKILYSVTYGLDQTFDLRDSNSLRFVCDGPYVKFVGIYVDGKEVEAGNYEAVSGSTDLTLSGEFIRTLDADSEHTLKFIYTDGESNEVSFKIKRSPAVNPNTGDNIQTWIAAMTLSVSALITMAFFNKKNA